MRRVAWQLRKLARAASATALLAACSGLGVGCAGWGGGQEGVDAEMLEQLRELQAERHSAEQAASEAPEPTLEQRLREGDRLRASGDLPRALWAYLRAQQIDRQDPRPRARIGAVRLQVDPTRAEEIFRELVATDDSAAVRTGLGLALIARQAFEPAIAELRAALDRDEQLAVAHDALGVALERTGDVAGARESYRRAAQLQPRSHEPFNNLGVSYLRTGEFPAAEQALRAAAQLAPRDPAVANNLGVALGRLGRYDEALTTFRKATGSEQAALNNLGYVHYLNGDYAGALDAYERALLAGGDTSEQRLAVLRNLRQAKRAQEGEPAAPADAASFLPATSEDPLPASLPFDDGGLP